MTINDNFPHLFIKLININLCIKNTLKTCDTQAKGRNFALVLTKG